MQDLALKCFPNSIPEPFLSFCRFFLALFESNLVETQLFELGNLSTPPLSRPIKDLAAMEKAFKADRGWRSTAAAAHGSSATT